jgi:LmbE family N-acetylglucosaminyl deacetylase
MPDRVSAATAARMLGRSPEYVRQLLVRGVFTVITKGGVSRGRGVRVCLWVDEIEAFAPAEDESAVRDLRRRKRRLKPQGVVG